MARVSVDRAAITKYFATDPGAQAALRVVAEQYKGVVEEASPVGTSAPWGKFGGVHGYFKRRFHVRGFRGGFRVYNRDAFAHLVEYGSVNNPAYAPFRRALRTFSGRSKINPKSGGGS